MAKQEPDTDKGRDTLRDPIADVYSYQKLEKFQICKIFLNVLEIIFLCSPVLHLFDQKYRKTAILWNIITT